jgi:hypothetical protein
MLKTVCGIGAALVLMTSTAPAAEREARDPGLRPHEAAQEFSAQRRRVVRVQRSTRVVVRSPRVYARSYSPGWYGGGPYVSVGFGSPYYSSYGYSPYYSSYAYSPYSTWGAYGDTPRYWSQARWGSPYASYAYGGYGWGPGIGVGVSFGRW